ncbi:MAG: endolytic transglycosylase MltG [Chloroflexi bacterium]|nr:endolytic transglycosylase MltG [Chloroflexota bacterium]MBU1751026.1 endolytic transglycosylase MltG [Chloroflexota bacterium]MBU1878936.1 endolytic transglycosylase MltG [Chloroflexota bacterium]
MIALKRLLLAVLVTVLLLLPTLACTSEESLEQALINAYLSLYEQEISTPASLDTSTVVFVIEKGETANSISQRLYMEGLIRDPDLFRLLARSKGVDNRLEAGQYILRRNMTMIEILEALGHGTVPANIVTILEGWRLEEVAEYLGDKGLADAQEFLRLAQAGQFQRDFLAGRPTGASVEGYLFPDTYQLATDMTATDIIDLMLDTFGRKISPELRDGAKNQGLSLHEVVTLASIVEREAVIKDEQPLIASVYLNRLTQKWPLQADPTVQYALGYQAQDQTWWKKRVYFVDLEVDSPYNTYMYKGLPLGPICSPGLEAIQAVINPQQSEYMFFVAKGDGAHAFAKTAEEFEQLVNQYQPRQ